jgi:hypothetical protein
LPRINSWFPGSGITPFTVDDLPLMWWLVYVARTKEAIEQETRRGN